MLGLLSKAVAEVWKHRYIATSESSVLHIQASKLEITSQGSNGEDLVQNGPVQSEITTTLTIRAKTWQMKQRTCGVPEKKREHERRALLDDVMVGDLFPRSAVPHVRSRYSTLTTLSALRPW